MSTELPGVVEWAIAEKPLEGQQVSGDRAMIAPVPGGVLLATIDGLGHGPNASRVADLTVSALSSTASAELEVLYQACQTTLNGTRGVVLSMAIYRAQHKSLRWTGVGNVEAALVHTDGTPLNLLVSRGGVVGAGGKVRLREVELPVGEGDVVVMATDGVRPEFARSISVNHPAQTTAEEVLKRFRRPDDDALVLVVRLGAER